MKKRFVRLFSLALCMVMILSMLSGISVFAAENSGKEEIVVAREKISSRATNAIGVDDWGDIAFTTFADLKELCAKTYSDWTVIYYVGNTDLVIKESITIPNNLDVYSFGYGTVVPKGVTLTVGNTAFLAADELTVEGTVNNNGSVSVGGGLKITGKLNNAGYLSLGNGLDTVLTGADKIVYTTEYSGLYWVCSFTNEAELKEIVQAASKASDTHWTYCAEFWDENATPLNLSSSMTIPSNCELQIYVPLMIKMAGNGKLTLNGTFFISDLVRVNGNMDVYGYGTIYAPLIVNGMLTNGGYLDIYYDDGGSLTVPGPGKYVGLTVDGYPACIYVNSQAATLPSDAVVGLDLKSFVIDEYHDDYFGDYWTLYNYNYTGSVAPADPAIASVPMYRMYDPNSSEHFYTGSTEERDILIAEGWNYEGVGFNFPVAGDPVHRLYEPKTGEHLYTMDEVEKDALLAAGWNYEGVAFNSATDVEVPQYRLHNPNASRGAYHFTGSTEERDQLMFLGWEYQGIGWYSCLK